MSQVSIRKCTCKSTFQDGRYGDGMRVMNFAKKKDAWRCTVCGREAK